jgi:hypothetical protein
LFGGLTVINRKVFSLLVVVCLLVATATAQAAKPGPSAPSLKVTFAQTAAATADSTSAAPTADTPYDVSGCGYADSGVTVVAYGPTATAFAGQTPTGGCIDLTNFATDGAGSYHVDAYQTIRNRAVKVASTSFTVQ